MTRRTVVTLMLNTSRNRAIAAHLVDPVARGLLRLGIGPDVVTAVGAIGLVAVAVTTFPAQEWLLGTLVASVFAVSDLLDGTMARLSDRQGAWGAFLDSTLDRITDAGLSLALLLGLIAMPDVAGSATWRTTAIAAAAVSLVAGQVIPYAKARAESLGVACDVGIAERAERVVLVLAVTLLLGLGVESLAVVVLTILAALSVITVGQRMVHVHRSMARAAAPGERPEAA